MEPKPVQRKGESHIAFHHRVNMWEIRVKPEMAKEARAIDKLVSRSPIIRPQYESANQKWERRTIHDCAQTNPVLLKLLRRGVA